MKKTYIVIGLGRFGSAVAQRLYELGSEVLAIDLRPELVQKMESRVTCAAVCDARDEDALRTLGVRNYDCAIVAIGGDLATSVVATLNLKELGVQRVVCKPPTRRSAARWKRSARIMSSCRNVSPASSWRSP